MKKEFTYKGGSRGLNKVLLIAASFSLIACVSDKYPQGTKENEIEHLMKENYPGFGLSTISIVDSVDSRPYSDSIRMTKEKLDSCGKIINDSLIIEILLPEAVSLSNLISLYNSGTDYAYSRYLVEGTQNNLQARYVAFVHSYPSKQIVLETYDDNKLKDQGEQIGKYHAIRQYIDSNNVIERLVALSQISNTELTKQKDAEIARREHERIEQEKRAERERIAQEREKREQEKAAERERIAKERAEKAAQKQKMVETLSDVKRLYKDLMSFRYNSGFLNRGFTINPYKAWLEQAEYLQAHAPKDFIFEYGFAVSELIAIGRHYVFSGGEDDDYSLYVRKNIEKAIRRSR